MSYPITSDDVLDYLGIDEEDDMITKNIARLIPVADSYLKGAIGDDYPVEDPRAKELALIVVADLYENRSLNQRVTEHTRKLVESMALQIRLEMRRA